MPIRDYPFIYYEQHSGKIIIGGEKSRPFLWIKVVNPSNGNSIITNALVDTGAFDSAFPAECAPRLGHNLKAARPKTICTSNGKTKAYPHTSTVDILDILPDGNPNLNRILYSLPRQLIDYTEDLGQFLLGQNNFLKKFILNIDYPKKRFSIVLSHLSRTRLRTRRY